MSVKTLGNHHTCPEVGTFKGFTINKQTVHSVVAFVESAVMRYRTRRQLAALDPRMLDDLGLSTADIHKEISKPFWQK